MIARCTAVGYRCDLRQRGAEDVTGGAGSSRRTPTSLPCSQARWITYPFGSSSEATAAGNVISAACSSANGSASSPAWRGCGPRARDTSRDGLSTAIMRPGQAIDASPGGPPVRRQQPERSGTSRRIAVGDPRTAVTAAISPQQPPELRLLVRRRPTEAAVRSRPQPAGDVAGGSWKQVSG